MPRANVKVVEVGSGFKNRQKEFATVLARVHLQTLSEATEKEIRATINELTTRPGGTGKLAGAFFAEKISDFSWGVGRIDFLNKEVPYWRHQNFGSLAIGANWIHAVPSGQFEPGEPQPLASAIGQGRWQVGQGSYSFVPVEPIPAKNYIEKTLAKILPNVRKIIRG